MKAVRLHEYGTRPELEEVPEPQITGPLDVIVRIGGAGLCRTDLHIIEGQWKEKSGIALPYTLGHENAGWVSALGADITGLEVGQPVAVYGCWGCGHCARCRLGVDTHCENPAAAPAPGGGGGLGVDGGLAEYLLVPDQRHPVPLPAALARCSRRR